MHSVTEAASAAAFGPLWARWPLPQPEEAECEATEADTWACVWCSGVGVRKKTLNFRRTPHRIRIASKLHWIPPQHSTQQTRPPFVKKKWTYFPASEIDPHANVAAVGTLVSRPAFRFVWAFHTKDDCLETRVLLSYTRYGREISVVTPTPEAQACSRAAALGAGRHARCGASR